MTTTDDFTDAQGRRYVGGKMVTACPPGVVCVCRDSANNDRLRDVLEALDGEVTARPETPAQVWAETMRTVSGLRLNAQMALDAADDAIRHRNEDNERWFAVCSDRGTRIEQLTEALRDVPKLLEHPDVEWRVVERCRALTEDDPKREPNDARNGSAEDGR